MTVLRLKLSVIFTKLNSFADQLFLAQTYAKIMPKRRPMRDFLNPMKICDQVIWKTFPARPSLIHLMKSRWRIGKGFTIWLHAGSVLAWSLAELPEPSTRRETARQFSSPWVDCRECRQASFQHARIGA
jgi:hypothetical protein